MRFAMNKNVKAELAWSHVGRLPLKGNRMLWTILLVLLILWALGFGLGVVGNLIHILLVVALVVLVMQMVTGRRGV